MGPHACATSGHARWHSAGHTRPARPARPTHGTCHAYCSAAAQCAAAHCAAAPPHADYAADVADMAGHAQLSAWLRFTNHAQLSHQPTAPVFDDTTLPRVTR